jgi:hypothetical protein
VFAPLAGLRLALGFEIERHCSANEKIETKSVLPPMKYSEINEERDKGQCTEENNREENCSRPENPGP